jgi:hypothetical protein
MTRWLAFSLALTVLVPACGGGNGPASLPFNPFGTEPASVDNNEPTGSDNEQPPPTPSTGGGGVSIDALCAQACTHIEAACPGRSGPDCATDCADTNVTGCEAQYRAFVTCIATSNLTCSSNGDLNVAVCQTAINAVSNCLNSTQGTPTSPPPTR